MKTVMALTLTLVIAGAFGALATDKPTASLKAVLEKVPIAEMPAKAAEVVKATKARERGTVAVEALRLGLELSTNSVLTLVASIAKAAPETAPVTAAAAAELQPKLAAEIARAAVAAAPTWVGKVVAAVCRVVPQDYKRIAVAVAEVLPKSGKEILTGVASAIPDLKPGIDAALAKYAKTSPPVGMILDSSIVASSTGTWANSASGSFSTPRGPTIAPPYVPYSGTTSSAKPSDSGPVPRGDRNYASP